MVLEGDEAEAEAALRCLPADDYDAWIRMGLILKRCFGDDGFPIWNAWSSKSAKYAGDDAARATWDGLQPNGSVGLGSLFHAAKEAGWNGPTDRVVREMNARFGILTHANKTLIIVKNGDRRPEDDFVWLGKYAFIDRLKSEPLMTEDGPKSKATHWLDHPRASHFHRVVFDPDRPAAASGVDWNLWDGFAVQPVPGDWGLLKAHIRDNVCRGDDQLYAWLVNWMAHGVQQPADVIGTAPVLLGAPGTGKGFLANAYGHLWGRHYTTVTHDEHVTGRFNSHLFGKRFVFIDEGIFGGDRKKAGIIKTRVTEEWAILEAKGVDPIKIRNRMIFMVASNELSIVPADIGDRRWQMFEVGEEHRNNQAYFAAIDEQLKNGGYEAMLHELLHRDVRVGPDPRITIKTPALFDQILRAQGAEVRYLHQVLDEGVLPQAGLNGGDEATTIRALHEAMRRSDPRGGYVAMNSFGRFLRTVIPGIETKPNGRYLVRRGPQGEQYTERSTRYRFPPLTVCRQAFEAFVGQEVPWTTDGREWAGGDKMEEDVPF